ncbi:hypothetical protein [Thioalkalivibrio sp. AKL19]|uniref:hypothetical protein n=1 Tax=Thioalkalivibrio sp. AKL19 TaxID=1266914 RepID=UPI0004291174|nr:hypothetical protein [Thioalkalivibrio sp. AKL19]
MLYQWENDHGPGFAWLEAGLILCQQAPKGFGIDGGIVRVGGVVLAIYVVGELLFLRLQGEDLFLHRASVTS